VSKSVGIGLDIGSGSRVGAPAPASPFGDFSVWLDFSDVDQVFTDAALTTPVTADGDPVRGVADKSGNGRKFTMPGGYDPLLWRPALMGCELYRHDALFPRLQSSGWNVGAVVGSGTVGTIFLVGRTFDTTDSALALSSEGYTSLQYDPVNATAIAGVWNGASADNATITGTASNTGFHIVMLRLGGGTIKVGLDNLADSALVSLATTGMDGVSLLQPLTTSYGLMFHALYASILVYPTTLSEAACMFNAAWAAGRWGIL